MTGGTENLKFLTNSDGSITGIILIAQESNLTLGQQPPPIRLSDLTIFAFTELPSLLTRIFALSFKS